MDNNSFLSALIGAAIPGIITYIIARKNRESNEEIARSVESNKESLLQIEQDFKLLVHSESELNKFRLAAIDKRLQVAQEAFEWWDKLVSVVHKDFNIRYCIVEDARKWWYSNCLYLSPEVRSEFFRILRLIEYYDELKMAARNSNSPSSRESVELENAFNDILDLSKLIEKSVYLPQLDIVRKDGDTNIPK